MIVDKVEDRKVVNQKPLNLGGILRKKTNALYVRA